MHFGGWHKNSLIDFPGELSCVLFVLGCNFDCPYCHNPDLIKGTVSRQALVSEKAVFDLLEIRKGFLDGVVISGGEPTLHKNLCLLCEKIKSMGYCIKIDTNGSQPQVIKELLSRDLVDYIAMDIKTEPTRYSPLITKDACSDVILASVQIIMTSAPSYEFRTTCVRPLVDAKTVENIAEIISGAALYVLQRFYRTRVLHPEFFNQETPGYSLDEMADLKSAAQPWVKKCIVR